MAHAASKIAFRIYNLVWSTAIPFLRLNQRISEGFSQKTLETPLPRADIWIQAASGGEAYLARSIIRRLSLPAFTRILLTANTRQGLEILEKTAAEKAGGKEVSFFTAYFPFDRPDTMKKAVDSVQPRLMVLLELELWPGLLLALKEHACRTIILNGRITGKSLKHYLRFKEVWRFLKPDKIMAISPEDGKRFQNLFPSSQVGLTPNIKFDALVPDDEEPTGKEGRGFFLPPEAPSVILGSVREEEEAVALKIIRKLFQKKPEAIIGLIPRHLHRTPHWRAALTKAGIPFLIRSGLTGPVSKGNVILWDIFGELTTAYSLFKAAFVGGTLAPLGGQNFLEPLICGVRPVIGPSWENFRWVGEDVIQEGLVRIGKEWEIVADILLDDLDRPEDRAQVKHQVSFYLNKRKGGVDMACGLIREALSLSSHKESKGP